MKEIKLDQRTYLKALRPVQVFVKDAKGNTQLAHHSAEHRVANMVGRLAAARLNNNPRFVNALDRAAASGAKLWDKARPGTYFHTAAHAIGKKLSGRLAKTANLQTERKLPPAAKSGYSKLDINVNDGIFDLKPGGKAGIRSGVGKPGVAGRKGMAQSGRHAGDFRRVTGRNPTGHQTLNWTDFSRAAGKGAGSHLQAFEPKGCQLPVKQSAPGSGTQRLNPNVLAKLRAANAAKQAGQQHADPGGKPGAKAGAGATKPGGLKPVGNAGPKSGGGLRPTGGGLLKPGGGSGFKPGGGGPGR